MLEEKSKHYDLIKVITTIFVVIAHATRMYTDKGVITPLNNSNILACITDFIYGFHMPLYICVSGMVYGLCIDDLNKYNNTLLFIKNKAIRLLIPYFIFGIFYVAPVMVLLNLTSSSYASYCVNGIFLGMNSRHLWFVFVLFLIFLLCAFAKKIIQRAHPLLLITLLFVISYLSGRLPSLFMINNLCYYFVFFYIGYCANKHYKTVAKITKNPITIILTVIAQVILFNYYNWIFVFIKALCGTAMTLGLVQYINTKICETKTYCSLKRNAYGVYLFHPMIIYILFYLFGKYDINPYVFCALVIIVTYALSQLFTCILRKIKLTFLIGE